jgi:hypothetical protein
MSASQELRDFCPKLILTRLICRFILTGVDVLVMGAFLQRPGSVLEIENACDRPARVWRFPWRNPIDAREIPWVFPSRSPQNPERPMIQAICPPRFERPDLPLSSSATLVAAVAQRLRTSPYLSLRQVRCCFWQGKLVLRGEVPTFYLKQMALTVARSLWLDDVLNEVRVAGPAARPRDDISDRKSEISDLRSPTTNSRVRPR